MPPPLLAVGKAAVTRTEILVEVSVGASVGVSVGASEEVSAAIVVVPLIVSVLIMSPPPMLQSFPSSQHPGSPLSPGPGTSQKVPGLHPPPKLQHSKPAVMQKLPHRTVPV